MNASPKIVVILAGGKAMRFGGRDKGEILIKGQRLIDIIHARLKPQSDNIIISGSQDYGLGLAVVPDNNKAPGGPVGGIYSLWKCLNQKGAQGFFTIAIDGPNFPCDLTDKLYLKDSSSIAVDGKGRHPTYGWWRMEDLSKVFKDTAPANSFSLNRLADLAGAKTIAWDGDKNFININRPKDLNKFVKGT